MLAYLSSPVCYFLGACSVARCELWPSRPMCAHLLPEHTLHVCSKQPGMNRAHLGFLGQAGPDLLIPSQCIRALDMSVWVGVPWTPLCAPVCAVAS